MKAYKISYERVHADYEGGVAVNSFALVFPRDMIKVPFSLSDVIRHQLNPKKNDFSVIKEVSEFDAKDKGLAKLAEMEPEEWVKYMDDGGGLPGYKYECVPVEVSDDIIMKLRQKIAVDKHLHETDELLKRIIFTR